VRDSGFAAVAAVGDGLAAARRRDRGMKFRRQASIAKLAATDMVIARELRKV
jgi:hypothetical protein